MIFSRNIKYLIYILFFISLLSCSTTPQRESTGEYFDDGMITTKVITAILQEPGLKSSEINVETFKNRVQLSGFVGTQAEINLAEKVAGKVKGVRSVKNDIQLKHTNP